MLLRMTRLAQNRKLIYFIFPGLTSLEILLVVDVQGGFPVPTVFTMKIALLKSLQTPLLPPRVF